MTAPDPAKVDQYIEFAAERLRESMHTTADKGRVDTDAARVWLDMARLQHERVRDRAAKEAEGQRDAVLRIVSEWVTRATEYGGVDAGDLVWHLEQPGFKLPEASDG